MAMPMIYNSFLEQGKLELLELLTFTALILNMGIIRETLIKVGTMPSWYKRAGLYASSLRLTSLL